MRVRRARAFDVAAETTAVGEHHAAHRARLRLGPRDVCLGLMIVQRRLQMRRVVAHIAVQRCRCQAQLWVGLTVTLANAVRCVLMVAQVAPGLERRVAMIALPVSMSAGTTAKQRTSATEVHTIDVGTPLLGGPEPSAAAGLLAVVVCCQRNARPANPGHRTHRRCFRGRRACASAAPCPDGSRPCTLHGRT